MTCVEVLNWPGPLMAHRVLTETAVSISELKKNPMATVAAGEGMAVAVLNRNEPAFHCVPAKAYEELMDLVEDLELGRMADARLADGQEPLRVSLNALCAGLSSRGPTHGQRQLPEPHRPYPGNARRMHCCRQ